MVKNISPPFRMVRYVHFDRIPVTGTAVTRVTDVDKSVFRKSFFAARERRPGRVEFSTTRDRLVVTWKRGESGGRVASRSFASTSGWKVYTPRAGRWPVKNKLGVALLALAIVMTWRVTSREEAPISAGTFFVYDNGGMQMRLTFSPADGDRFDTNVSYVGEDGTYPSAQPSSAPSNVVDTRMRTADGQIFELGSLGPLWVPPNDNFLLLCCNIRVLCCNIRAMTRDARHLKRIR